MADSINFTAADLDRLGAKLDSLELTNDERALMMAVFQAAARALTAEAAGEDLAEVSGFSYSFGATSLSQGFQGAVKPIATFKQGLAVGGDRSIIIIGGLNFYN